MLKLVLRIHTCPIWCPKGEFPTVHPWSFRWRGTPLRIPHNLSIHHDLSAYMSFYQMRFDASYTLLNSLFRMWLPILMFTCIFSANPLLEEPR